MKKLFSLFAFSLFAFTAFAAPRIVVERPTPPPDTAHATVPDTLRRMVIDPAQMIYQMQVDSINRETEEKVKRFIGQIERNFQDPQVEEEMGKLIGEAVMEQQMALLNLQIDRAISVRDTLLLKGLETALQQLILHSDVVREQIRKQLDALQREMQAK
jgi:hypothetical protein